MRTRNVKCEISYDGANYHGFQAQPRDKTVQGEIQKALYKISNKQIIITASGRTDAGVHARKQVINFNIDSNIPIKKLPIILNLLLPKDIIIKSAFEMPCDFHSRFNVKGKTYRYSIYNANTVDVFRRNYTWHYPYFLDVSAMSKASLLFLGEHDFSAFSSVKAKSYRVRKIYESSVWKEGNEIVFQVSGEGFLHNMVRILTGTLVKVGNGRMLPEEIPFLFDSKDRKLAGVTAPAKGLTLWDVMY